MASAEVILQAEQASSLTYQYGLLSVRELGASGDVVDLAFARLATKDYVRIEVPIELYDEAAHVWSTNPLMKTDAAFADLVSRSRLRTGFNRLPYAKIYRGEDVMRVRVPQMTRAAAARHFIVGFNKDGSAGPLHAAGTYTVVLGNVYEDTFLLRGDEAQLSVPLLNGRSVVQAGNFQEVRPAGSAHLYRWIQQRSPAMPNPGLTQLNEALAGAWAGVMQHPTRSFLHTLAANSSLLVTLEPHAFAVTAMLLGATPTVAQNVERFRWPQLVANGAPQYQTWEEVRQVLVKGYSIIVPARLRNHAALVRDFCSDLMINLITQRSSSSIRFLGQDEETRALNLAPVDQHSSGTYTCSIATNGESQLRGNVDGLDDTEGFGIEWTVVGQFRVNVLSKDSLNAETEQSDLFPRVNILGKNFQGLLSLRNGSRLIQGAPDDAHVRWHVDVANLLHRNHRQLFLDLQPTLTGKHLRGAVDLLTDYSRLSRLLPFGPPLNDGRTDDDERIGTATSLSLPFSATEIERSLATPDARVSIIAAYLDVNEQYGVDGASRSAVATERGGSLVSQLDERYAWRTASDDVDVVVGGDQSRTRSVMGWNSGGARKLLGLFLLSIGKPPIAAQPYAEPVPLPAEPVITQRALTLRARLEGRPAALAKVIRALHRNRLNAAIYVKNQLGSQGAPNDGAFPNISELFGALQLLPVSGNFSARPATSLDAWWMRPSSEGGALLIAPHGTGEGFGVFEYPDYSRLTSDAVKWFEMCHAAYGYNIEGYAATIDTLNDQEIIRRWFSTISNRTEPVLERLEARLARQNERSRVIARASDIRIAVTSTASFVSALTSKQVDVSNAPLAAVASALKTTEPQLGETDDERLTRVEAAISIEQRLHRLEQVFARNNVNASPSTYTLKDVSQEVENLLKSPISLASDEDKEFLKGMFSIDAVVKRTEDAGAILSAIASEESKTAQRTEVLPPYPPLPSPLLPPFPAATTTTPAPRPVPTAPFVPAPAPSVPDSISAAEAARIRSGHRAMLRDIQVRIDAGYDASIGKIVATERSALQSASQDLDYIEQQFSAAGSVSAVRPYLSEFRESIRFEISYIDSTLQQEVYESVDLIVGYINGAPETQHASILTAKVWTAIMTSYSGDFTKLDDAIDGVFDQVKSALGPVLTGVTVRSAPQPARGKSSIGSVVAEYDRLFFDASGARSIPARFIIPDSDVYTRFARRVRLVLTTARSNAVDALQANSALSSLMRRAERISQLSAASDSVKRRARERLNELAAVRANLERQIAQIQGVLNSIAAAIDNDLRSTAGKELSLRAFVGVITSVPAAREEGRADAAQATYELVETYIDTAAQKERFIQQLEDEVRAAVSTAGGATTTATIPATISTRPTSISAIVDGHRVFITRTLQVSDATLDASENVRLAKLYFDGSSDEATKKATALGYIREMWLTKACLDAVAFALAERLATIPIESIDKGMVSRLALELARSLGRKDGVELISAEAASKNGILSTLNEVLSNPVWADSANATVDTVKAEIAVRRSKSEQFTSTAMSFVRNTLQELQGLRFSISMSAALGAIEKVISDASATGVVITAEDIRQALLADGSPVMGIITEGFALFVSEPWKRLTEELSAVARLPYISSLLSWNDWSNRPASGERGISVDNTLRPDGTSALENLLQLGSMGGKVAFSRLQAIYGSSKAGPPITNTEELDSTLLVWRFMRRSIRAGWFSLSDMIGAHFALRYADYAVKPLTASAIGNASLTPVLVAHAARRTVEAFILALQTKNCVPVIVRAVGGSRDLALGILGEFSLLIVEKITDLLRGTPFPKVRVAVSVVLQRLEKLFGSGATQEARNSIVNQAHLAFTALYEKMSALIAANYGDKNFGLKQDVMHTDNTLDSDKATELTKLLLGDIAPLAMKYFTLHCSYTSGLSSHFLLASLRLLNVIQPGGVSSRSTRLSIEDIAYYFGRKNDLALHQVLGRPERLLIRPKSRHQWSAAEFNSSTGDLFVMAYDDPSAPISPQTEEAVLGWFEPGKQTFLSKLRTWDVAEVMITASLSVGMCERLKELLKQSGAASAPPSVSPPPPPEPEPSRALTIEQQATPFNERVLAGLAKIRQDIVSRLTLSDVQSEELSAGLLAAKKKLSYDPTGTQPSIVEMELLRREQGLEADLADAKREIEGAINAKTRKRNAPRLDQLRQRIKKSEEQVSQSLTQS